MRGPHRTLLPQNSRGLGARALALLLAMLGAASAPARDPASAAPLAEQFANPPREARPLTWWRFMDDLVSREGIAAELDFMDRIGLSGAVVSFCASRGPLAPPVEGLPRVPMLGDEWWQLTGLVQSQAAARDLKLWFQASPGYATTGGPWITPEQSMQKLVWTRVELAEDAPGQVTLARPKVDPKWNHYRDVVVLAYPTVDTSTPVPFGSIVQVPSAALDGDALAWSPPRPGRWTVVRLGHTTTGKTVHPAPITGVGLEADKLDRAATKVQFDRYFKRVLSHAPKRAQSSLFFDSYEAEYQNWSPRFRDRFKELRGYDPVPWVLAATGVLVDDELSTRRFDHDWRRTIEQLVATEHLAELVRLSRESGAGPTRLQPYNGPIDFMAAGAFADIPEGEFWHVNKGYGWWTLRMIASVAHVNGRPIASAETLTASPEDLRGDKHPWSTKAETDLAFALGINEMALHVVPHNPWPKLRPGMMAGPYPPLLTVTQPWAEFARPWVDYLARTAHVLRQGRFVADVLTVSQSGQRGFTPPPGHNSDLCHEALIVDALRWDGTSLVLPSGMRYRLLEVPDTTKDLPRFSPANLRKELREKAYGQRMSLPLLRKVRALLHEGASVLAPRPLELPGIARPEDSLEFARLVDELWGSGAAAGGDTLRRVGKGTLITTGTAAEALVRLGVEKDFDTEGNLPFETIAWTHRSVGEDEFYFVSNQGDEPRTIEASFRVSGRRPELWKADTGEIVATDAWSEGKGRTQVTLHLEARESVFVRFTTSQTAQSPERGRTEFALVRPTPPWSLQFDPERGGPRAALKLEELRSWTELPDTGAQRYSGPATYAVRFDVPEALLRRADAVTLDLGQVRDLARVTVNGRKIADLWRPPFRVDIRGALKAGGNALEVTVANVWFNRLLGDEKEPADLRWGDERYGTNRGIRLYAGRPLGEWPGWLLRGEPRPSAGRQTFTTWNYLRDDEPPLPAGLLGPVSVRFLEAPKSSAP